MAVATALAVVACGHEAELKPAAGATQPSDVNNAVAASQNSVRVVAQVHEWPGPADIDEVVTPVRIIIDNGSKQPLAVRYSDFRISAPNAQVYRAVPPRESRGTVDTEPHMTPLFTYHEFYVAPYYRDYYTGVPSYTGVFELDQPYYNRYYAYWQSEAQLPTSQMLARSLPEGVIGPGGKVDGYLYFQKVQQKKGASVELLVTLKNAAGDQDVVSADLPFVLK